MTDYRLELTDSELSERIKAVMKAAGIMIVFDGYLTARFPDGQTVLFRNVEIDTEKQ